MRLRTGEPASNDNAWEPPVVRRPAGRPEAAYARSANPSAATRSPAATPASIIGDFGRPNITSDGSNALIAAAIASARRLSRAAMLYSAPCAFT